MDLDSDEPVWTPPAHRTKNREGHRVPLSPIAVDLIREAKSLSGESEYVFPSPKGDQPIGAMAATRAMVRARPILGLDDFRIHDLQRTAATGMAQLGISPHTISLVLNHVSARKGTITSTVYVKYSYDAEKRAALNAWGAHLKKVLGQPITHA
ncbi:MAG: site-specific integrase [Hyphomicrobiaceae bacterium]